MNNLKTIIENILNSWSESISDDFETFEEIDFEEAMISFLEDYQIILDDNNDEDAALALCIRDYCNADKFFSDREIRASEEYARIDKIFNEYINIFEEALAYALQKNDDFGMIELSRFNKAGKAFEDINKFADAFIDYILGNNFADLIEELEKEKEAA